MTRPAAARDDFVSQLLHDLKAPLALITGYAELLRSRDDEQIRREAPDAIVAAAERLAPALDAAVAALAAETGHVSLDRVRIDVRTAVEEAAAAISPPPRLELRVEPDLHVSADREWLHQLLVCLLATGRQDALALEARPTGANATLTLRRTTPMSFLAAHAVRRLSELHGGRFWVADAGDGARRAHCVLPLADRPAEAGVRTILVADDDETVRALLRMTLPRESYEILEAADGAEALALARRRAPDLVLLDWRMPERPGPEVLDELQRTASHVPVVVLTAETEPAQRARAAELGATAFLTKPFSPIQLLGLVERLLP